MQKNIPEARDADASQASEGESLVAVGGCWWWWLTLVVVRGDVGGHRAVFGGGDVTWRHGWSLSLWFLYT